MSEDRRTAQYGSWETMKNAIAQFAEGVPHRIDRTAFPGLAWNATTRLLNGLRFLGLTDDEGVPTPRLLQLAAVTDEGKRKDEIEKIIKSSFAEVFKLDLTRTTPALLAETLGNAYNASGDTREKAVRFFLSAVAYVGIPVSPLLSRDKARRATGATGRMKRLRPIANTPRTKYEEPPAMPSGATTRTVTLRSGGTLTVSAAVDFLSLDADDRAFVFSLIDRLTAYEQGGM